MRTAVTRLVLALTHTQWKLMYIDTNHPRIWLYYCTHLYIDIYICSNTHKL